MFCDKEVWIDEVILSTSCARLTGSGGGEVGVEDRRGVSRVVRHRHWVSDAPRATGSAVPRDKKRDKVNFGFKRGLRAVVEHKTDSVSNITWLDPD